MHRPHPTATATAPPPPPAPERRDGAPRRPGIARRVRTLAMAAALAGLVAAGTPSPPADAQPGRASPPVAVIEGRGWGHGVGLSQLGAKALAERGASGPDILATFYPGTTLRTVDRGAPVTVVLAEGNATSLLSFPAGGTIRSPADGPQAPGFPLQVPPGATVTVRADGAGARASVGASGASASPAAPWNGGGVASVATPAQGDCLPLLPCTPPPPSDPPADHPEPEPAPDPPEDTEAPEAPEPPAPGPAPEPAAAHTTSPLLAVPADGGTTRVHERERTYRGRVEVQPAGGALKVRNHVDAEVYAASMGEMSPSWPPAALQAQAVAVRTYALRAMRSAGELCDDARCQVYLGVEGESGPERAAAQATAGQVLTFDGQLAATYYSADAGGITATPAEAFGPGSAELPYLVPVPHPSPETETWRVEVDLARAAAIAGYRGTVQSIGVGRAGPSGRPAAVRIEGSAGPHEVEARAFTRALGLKSDLWTIRLGTPGDAAAPAADRTPSVLGATLAAQERLVGPSPTAAPAGGVLPLTGADAARLPPSDPRALVAAALIVAVGAAAHRQRVRTSRPARPR